jgi:hypothetical protein
MNAVCRNTEGNFTCSCNSGFRGNGFDCTDIDECKEEMNCDVNAFCINTDGSFLCHCSEGYTGNGDTCNCTDGNVMLVGGSTESEGRIEICINNTYGTVCDDMFDINEAAVICRQLNFTGASVPLSESFFGSGSGSIFLDNLACTGDEASLLKCARSENNCDHSEDAGVICNSTASCMEGGVRLLIDDEATFYLTEHVRESYYFIKDHLARGRVEVCIGGQFGTIRNHQWTYLEASVACRQLKFSSYGKQGCQQCKFVRACLMHLFFLHTHT